MQESYANVWRGSEYLPEDPFARLVWEHEPGQGDSFDLKYRVSIDQKLIDRAFDANWTFSFPGFPNSHNFPVFVQFSPAIANPDQRMTLNVSSLHTVRDVKALIGASKHFPVDHLRLFLNGRLLEDEFTLKDSRVEAACTLTLVLMSQDRYNIFLKPLTGNTLMFGVSNSDTIDSLLCKQQEVKGGWNPDQIEFTQRETTAG